MSNQREGGYSLKQLCQEADVSVRTVRYYMQQGLLPAAERSGPGVRYPLGHLWRLQLIRLLRGRHLPLAAIRQEIETLSDEQVRELLASDAVPAAPSSAADYVQSLLGGGDPQPQPRRSSSKTGLRSPSSGSSGNGGTSGRSRWERISVHPDVEIHARRPLSPDTNRRLKELVARAEELFQA